MEIDNKYKIPDYYATYFYIPRLGDDDDNAKKLLPGFQMTTPIQYHGRLASDACPTYYLEIVITEECFSSDCDLELIKAVMLKLDSEYQREWGKKIPHYKEKILARMLGDYCLGETNRKKVLTDKTITFVSESLWSLKLVTALIILFLAVGFALPPAAPLLLGVLAISIFPTIIGSLVDFFKLYTVAKRYLLPQSAIKRKLEMLLDPASESEYRSEENDTKTPLVFMKDTAFLHFGFFARKDKEEPSYRLEEMQEVGENIPLLRCHTKM